MKQNGHLRLVSSVADLEEQTAQGINNTTKQIKFVFGLQSVDWTLPFAVSCFANCVTLERSKSEEHVGRMTEELAQARHEERPTKNARKMTFK